MESFTLLKMMWRNKDGEVSVEALRERFSKWHLPFLPVLSQILLDGHRWCQSQYNRARHTWRRAAVNAICLLITLTERYFTDKCVICEKSSYFLPSWFLWKHLASLNRSWKISICCFGDSFNLCSRWVRELRALCSWCFSWCATSLY